MESQNLDHNTIAVDWGDLSRCSYVHLVNFIVPSIGQQFYIMLNDIFRHNLRKINCVGHSLVCGYASMCIRLQIEWFIFTFFFDLIIEFMQVPHPSSGGQFTHCFGLFILNLV